MRGLIFFPGRRKRLNSFTESTPALEAMINAQKPRPNIRRVSVVRNLSAWVDAPTVSPRRIVTMSVIAFEAVFASRVVTPLSRSRFPKKSIPRSGSPEGTTKQVRIRPTMGNIIFSA